MDKDRVKQNWSIINTQCVVLMKQYLTLQKRQMIL